MSIAMLTLRLYLILLLFITPISTYTLFQTELNHPPLPHLPRASGRSTPFQRFVSTRPAPHVPFLWEDPVVVTPFRSLDSALPPGPPNSKPTSKQPRIATPRGNPSITHNNSHLIPKTFPATNTLIPNWVVVQHCVCLPSSPSPNVRSSQS